MHTKLGLRSYKEGEEDTTTLIQCQLRTLPGGLLEFVFPKEYEDIVLTSLNFHLPTPYNLDKELGFMAFKISPMKKLREFLRIEEAPKKFKTDKKLPIVSDWVSIIPIGVRYDGEVTEADGWKHEAI